MVPASTVYDVAENGRPSSEANVQSTRAYSPLADDTVGRPSIGILAMSWPEHDEAMQFIACSTKFDAALCDAAVPET